MLYDINKVLCETYTGLNPLELLNYPAEDVFNLINGLIDYNQRHDKDNKQSAKGDVIRRPAGDNWF